MVEESAQARRTRKHIRSSLIELLKAHSFEDITVAMLAQAADVNRSTIYRYYDSLFDVLGDCIYEIAGKADARIPSSKDEREFMREVWEAVADSYRSIRDNVELYSFLRKHPKPSIGSAEHASVVERHSEAYYQGLVGGLVDLGVTLTVPPRCLESVLGSISGSIVRYWMSAGFIESPEEMADLTVNLFEKAIEAVSSSSLS